jgi:ribonuclease HI
LNVPNDRNFAITVPKIYAQTNQTGEIMAIAEACKNIDPSNNLYIETDSKYAIQALITNQEKQDECGYIGGANWEIIQMTRARMQKRSGAIAMKWVKGHAGHDRNKGADQQAASGAQKTLQQRPNVIRITKLPKYGARLETLTQSRAYHGIHEEKMRHYKCREQAVDMINKAQNEIEDLFDIMHTEGAIWKSMRRKEITKEARTFLWRTAQDSFMVGDKWLRKDFSDKHKMNSECKICGTLDNMEHILTRCESNKCCTIWTCQGRA